ncbi:cytochrome P450 [Pisolithus marmoratus]|nr:cytochrome P450 [Pisolithus marmoratus]
MVRIPPGFVYIADRLPRLVNPLLLAYAGNRIWAIVFKKPSPRWLSVSVYLFSIPLAMSCTVLYTYLRDRREAARRGATLALRVKSRWHGSLDTIVSVARTFQNAHTGMHRMVAPFNQYCQEYGPVVNVRILFEDQILTTEPEHIKGCGFLCQTFFSTTDLGPVLFDQSNSSFGTGVFSSGASRIRFHRSMTRPFFSKDRISHFDIFEKHTEDALSQAKARLQEGYPVDFQDMVYRFTLDSATEFLFGKSVCSLSAGLVYPKNSVLGQSKEYTSHPANIFARALSVAQSHTTLRGRLGTFWRLAEFWSDRVAKEMEVFYKFIDPILRASLETKRSMREGEQSTGQVCNEERGILEDTLLGHLIDCTDGKADEIVNILIAGRDTTATTLTFLVYMLSQHPDVLKRLRTEVLSAVRSSRRPTYNEVREMKYMRAVINGAVVCLAYFSLCRTSIEAVTWPGVNGGPPIYIPPNTRIPYTVFLMHRRKDLWGPDAEMFDPDRFLDERSKYLTSNPFIFLPFNAGPRICLGREASDNFSTLKPMTFDWNLQFAYNEMSFFLVRLLQTFSSITLVEDMQTRSPAEWGEGMGCNSQEKVVIRHHLTLYVDEGLWVQMLEADDAGNM